MSRPKFKAKQPGREAKKKPALLTRLLSNGYLPRELPPPFTSESFGEAVTKNESAADSAFAQDRPPAKPAIHDLARVGTLRRTLGIPNPIYHYRLCKEISNEWKSIDRLIRESTVSRSRPIEVPTDDRALRRLNLLEDLPGERALVRSTSRYIVRTDITSFYHSIYTHSIPWAIHGKEQAKASQQDMDLLGNRIDKAVRSGQDNQTIGIPVGPDTSLVIAELLLCRIDVQLQGKLNGFRYVDDYECGFKSREEAESQLAELQRKLAEYELSLNPRKTTIIQLPHQLERPWVHELRKFSFDNEERKQKHDLIRFFDRTFELAATYPDDSVMLYAISRAHAAEVHEANLTVFQHLLMQAMLIESGVLPYVLHILAKHADSPDLDRDRLTQCLEDIILRHTWSLHGSEVAWALWGAILFNVRLRGEIVERVAVLNDPVPALLALDVRNRNLITGNMDVAKWVDAMSKDGLSKKNWMLTYEAQRREWLQSKTDDDCFADDEAFTFLSQHDVHFYHDVSPVEAMLEHAASSAKERDY